MAAIVATGIYLLTITYITVCIALIYSTYIAFVIEYAKTGICTSNYTHSMNFNTKLASFTLLCLVSLVSNLYTYSSPTG